MDDSKNCLPALARIITDTPTQQPNRTPTVPLTSNIVKFLTKIRDQREQAIPTER